MLELCINECNNAIKFQFKRSSEKESIFETALDFNDCIDLAQSLIYLIKKYDKYADEKISREEIDETLKQYASWINKPLSKGAT